MYIYLPALGYTPLLVVFLYVHIRSRPRKVGSGGANLYVCLYTYREQ